MPELTSIFCPDFSVQRSAFSVERSSRSAFTVIELLIVIGVLSVLLSILLPVFRNARTATLRTRARIQATALAQAVIQYKNVYGYWPGMMTDSGSQLARNTAALTVETLDTPFVCRGSNQWFEIRQNGLATQVNHVPQGDNTLYRSLLPFDTRHSGDKNRNPLNPSRIRFIELKSEAAPQGTAYPDPWNKEFCVVMGLNPSRLTTLYDGSWPIISFSNQVAAVVCRSQTANNTTLYFLNAGITNGFIRRVN